MFKKLTYHIRFCDLIYFFNFIAAIEEEDGNHRGGVTSIADIAFSTLNSGKIIIYF